MDAYSYWTRNYPTEQPHYHVSPYENRQPEPKLNANRTPDAQSIVNRTNISSRQPESWRNRPIEEKPKASEMRSSSNRPTEHRRTHEPRPWNIYTRPPKTTTTSPRSLYVRSTTTPRVVTSSVNHEDSALRRLFLTKNIEIADSIKLGAGRYSKVITAKQFIGPGEAIKIAIKVINLEKVTSDFRVKFLPREIACWRQLNHPYLVQLRGHYEALGKVFLTMAYGEKGDLLRYVQKHGPTPEARARLWMGQAFEAVRYMHSKGIAHRDLKLENLILFSDDVLKVADFGFCRYVQGHSTTYCGSRSYSAPEILLGRPYEPFKADVWSLGVILFIIVTDTMPFREFSSNRKIAECQKARDYRYPRRLALSQECTATADLMMTYDPVYRPSIQGCLTLPFFTMMAAGGGNQNPVG